MSRRVSPTARLTNRQGRRMKYFISAEGPLGRSRGIVTATGLRGAEDGAPPTEFESVNDAVAAIIVGVANKADQFGAEDALAIFQSIKLQIEDETGARI